MIKSLYQIIRRELEAPEEIKTTNSSILHKRIIEFLLRSNYKEVIKSKIIDKDWKLFKYQYNAKNNEHLEYIGCEQKNNDLKTVMFVPDEKTLSDFYIRCLSKKHIFYDELDRLNLLFDEVLQIEGGEKTKFPTNVIIEKKPDAIWEDVLFLFPVEGETINNESRIGVKIKRGTRYQFYDFKNLNLIKINGELRRNWLTLNLLILNESYKRNFIGMKAKDTKQTTQINRLRKYLCKFTGIKDNPFLSYDKKDLWKPKFRSRFDQTDSIKKAQSERKHKVKQRGKTRY